MCQKQAPADKITLLVMVHYRFLIGPFKGSQGRHAEAVLAFSVWAVLVANVIVGMVPLPAKRSWDRFGAWAGSRWSRSVGGQFGVSRRDSKGASSRHDEAPWPFSFGPF